MGFFTRRRNWGMLLLGVWLIVTGVLQLGLIAAAPYAGHVVAGLAIVAGVLILLDR
jgi:hypothetical protein